jgi:hypothetical protein
MDKVLRGNAARVLLAWKRAAAEVAPAPTHVARTLAALVELRRREAGHPTPIGLVSRVGRHAAHSAAGFSSMAIACRATAPVWSASPPATVTVGKANLMPLASNAFLILS